MIPEEIEFIRQCLPETVGFPYFADRESAWLMRRALVAPVRVRDLRAGSFGKLLERPVVKPVVARSGGLLSRADFDMLAAADIPAVFEVSAAASAGGEVAAACPWFDFSLTFESWGTSGTWHWNQTSRKGSNLVVQLGFPSQHARLLGRYLGRNIRKEVEYSEHPIRETGCPTIAWARLDVDLGAGVALVEEVQSDWLRNVADCVSDLKRHAPRSRDLRQMEAYDRGLRQTYARIWPKAMLLAALYVAVDLLGCRIVWMHTPEGGVALKHIKWTPPPRSLYTELPKAFCFVLVREAPVFLSRPRRRALSLLANNERPYFWKLAV